MVHAAKHASAHRIIAVTPWYGYSRQDKKSAPREPISARLVAELLEVAGIDRLVTMDLHAGQMQGFFSKPVDHMTAMPILTQFVHDRLGDEDLVIIAPDAGRVKLVAQLRAQGRRALRADGEGAARPGGGRDRLRDRRREGQDRGDRRRHHRHRRHAQRRRADRARRGRRARCTRSPPTALFSGNAFETLAASPLVGHRRHRHRAAARGRARPDHPAHLRRHPRPTRSAGSSSTTRSPRSSPARTSSSRATAAVALGPGALLLAQLGGRRLAEPPLAADPVPVARGARAGRARPARPTPCAVPSARSRAGSRGASRGRSRSAGRTPRRSPPSRARSRS